MQGTWVRSLVQENLTYCRATKPMCQNYYAHVLQLLKPLCPPAQAPQERPPNEKPMHRN